MFFFSSLFSTLILWPPFWIEATVRWNKIVNELETTEINGNVVSTQARLQVHMASAPRCHTFRVLRVVSFPSHPSTSLATGSPSSLKAKEVQKHIDKEAGLLLQEHHSHNDHS